MYHNYFGEGLRTKGKKIKQIYLKYCSENSTKTATTVSKFSKFSAGACPVPLEPFLFLNLLQIKSAEKKLCLKM